MFSRSVLDHLEVDLGDVCADHVSCAAVDDGAVALSLVLILYEPEWRVQIGRFLNSETGVEPCYLVHFLFQEESLVLLNFIFRSNNSLIAVQFAIQKFRLRLYLSEVEGYLSFSRDSIVSCREFCSLSSQDQPVVLVLNRSFSCCYR